MMQFRFVVASVLLFSAGAVGQEPMRMHRGPGGPPPGPPGGDFAFVRPEFGVSGRIVKSAPYSAQVVTQHTQTLADGNRIQRTTTASVARDSEGRTRSEQSMGAIGPLTSSNGASKAVFIHDPVAGASYMLDEANHTARQSPAMRPRGNPDAAAPRRVGPGGGDSAAGFSRQRVQENRKVEELGTQIMEGLSVQGKRVTHTIPAGQFGNERAIDIVSETWFSPELQTVVMSRTSDPRMGDTVFKLTNVSRSEPDHALFQVPSDYTVTQAGGRGGALQMRRKNDQ